MKKYLLKIIIIGIFVLGLVGCGNRDKDEKFVLKGSQYALGEPFVFRGLEYTFDTTYSFTTIDNQYSNHNKEEVIKIGATVKNVSEELNSIDKHYISTLGPNGKKLDSISVSFGDSFNHADDLEQNASFKTYFYLLYVGNGEYYIAFDGEEQDTYVIFGVVK